MRRQFFFFLKKKFVLGTILGLKGLGPTRAKVVLSELNVTTLKSINKMTHIKFCSSRDDVSNKYMIKISEL
jgi:ribosomal protein S13